MTSTGWKSFVIRFTGLHDIAGANAILAQLGLASPIAKGPHQGLRRPFNNGFRLPADEVDRIAKQVERLKGVEITYPAPPTHKKKKRH